MKTENQNVASFAAQLAKDAEAQMHQQEIQNTRVGGLGGSDAALILKIAIQGLAALTTTDMKRLCVMTGQAEPDNFGGNAYTNAGHAFEEYAENILPLDGIKYEREKYIENRLADKFKTFAHADFAIMDNSDLVVIECKYVQIPTEKVIWKYYAQLQWYYMLGANRVALYHGMGAVDPFCPEECNFVEIPRDDQTVEILLQGIKILNDALREGWLPELPDKMAVEDAPDNVRKAFAELASVKMEEKAIAARKAAAQAVLKDFCEDMSLTGIYSNAEKKVQIIYAKATSGKAFDAAKFLAEHPEINAEDTPEYFKETKRSASVTMR